MSIPSHASVKIQNLIKHIHPLPEPNPMLYQKNYQSFHNKSYFFNYSNTAAQLSSVAGSHSRRRDWRPIIKWCLKFNILINKRTNIINRNAFILIQFFFYLYPIYTYVYIVEYRNSILCANYHYTWTTVLFLHSISNLTMRQKQNFSLNFILIHSFILFISTKVDF